MMRGKWTILLLFAVLVGCDRHDGHRHEHNDDSHGAEASHGHSHGDDAQSFSGATHKEGKGITLLPETKERLGVELSEVAEDTLPIEISFAARVFSHDHKEARAAGTLATQRAQSLKKGTAVTLVTPGGAAIQGQVLNLSHPISTNETEVVVGFNASPESVPVGSTLRATASIPTNDPVTIVPKEALIKGTTESFVYVQNDDAYLRTVVTPGRETADAVEVKEGLLEGDLVVSRGAMDLWLVELRAVKGGQGCCPAPPTKGKGK